MLAQACAGIACLAAGIPALIHGGPAVERAPASSLACIQATWAAITRDERALAAEVCAQED